MTSSVTSHVGWDIGIKNLAHCLVKKLPADQSITGLTNIITISGNHYQIPAATWDVIDFSKGAGDKVNERGEMMLIQRPQVLCKCDTGKIKNGTTLCNKSASYCKVDRTADSIYYGYCANHFKKANLDLSQVMLTKIGSCTCFAPGIKDSTKRCGAKAWYLERNHLYKGYCKKHYNMFTNAKHNPTTLRQEDEFYKVIKSKSVTSLDLTLLTESLYKELDNKPELTHVSQILLENQPVFKNPTMKTIQSLLYGYFVIKGRMIPTSVNKTIQCYFAANKLDLVKFVDEANREVMKGILKQSKDQYAKNKSLAILLVNYYLDNCSTNAAELKAKFAVCSKKDDMADSLLMTLHALEKTRLAKIKNVDVSCVGLNKRKKNSPPATTDDEAASTTPTANQVDEEDTEHNQEVECEESVSEAETDD
jgi:hypothetical protein